MKFLLKLILLALVLIMLIKSCEAQTKAITFTSSYTLSFTSDTVSTDTSDLTLFFKNTVMPFGQNVRDSIISDSLFYQGLYDKVSEYIPDLYKTDSL